MLFGIVKRLNGFDGIELSFLVYGFCIDMIINYKYLGVYLDFILNFGIYFCKIYKKVVGRVNFL